MRGLAMRVYWLVCAVILVSCQTTPTRYSVQNEGHWQAKSLIRDKVAGRSAVVALDINAKRESRQMRIDIQAALGHPVGVMAMNEDRLTYVVFEEKRYYSGSASSASLKPLIGVPLDPQILFNILFDLPIPNKDWTCSQDAKGFLKECRQTSQGLSIRWDERRGQRRSIFVEHSAGQLQLNLDHYQPKVEERAKLFEINPPKSFKPIR